MKYLLILCFAFNGLLAQPPQKTYAEPEEEYYLTSSATTRYALFKYDIERDRYIGFDKNDTPTSLSDAEINQIEKLIINKVTRYNKENSKAGHEDWNIKSPEKYFKQIIAVVNRKGEKEVWVNCLCHVQKESWKKVIPLINDGGSCYFQLKINLKRKKVYDFGVNGVA